MQISNCKLKTNNSKIWRLYFCSKLIYAFIALYVIGEFIQLGDSRQYIDGTHYDWSEAIYNSTKMVGSIAHVLNNIFGLAVATLFFISLSFYGVYYPLSKINLSKQSLVTLVVVLSIPSFGIWSSIVSKEAVIIFGMGLILGLLIDVLEEKKHKDFVMGALGFCIVTLFKPHYLYPLLSLFFYVCVAAHFKRSDASATFLVFVYSCISVLMLVVFRDELNWFADEIPLHFDPDGGTTRLNEYFLEKDDIFWMIPYGIFISFFGPTLFEASKSIALQYSFFESLLVLGLFCFFMIRIWLAKTREGRVKLFGFAMFFIFASGILVVNYPFGLFNPGSAVRYRSGYFPFIVILFYYAFFKSNRSFK